MNYKKKGSLVVRRGSDGGCYVELPTHLVTWVNVHKSIYRKIPKISPWAYIFSKALFEGLILGGGGAYVRREICVSKSIGLACSGKENLPFLLCFTLYSRATPSTSPPPGGGGGLYSEGRFNGGSSALRFWGAYIWRGLCSEFYGT